MNIHVALIDHHPYATRALLDMLALYPYIRVTDAYTTGWDFIKRLSHRQPDVLLLDAPLSDIPANELVAIVHDGYPAIGILALTGSANALATIHSLEQKGCLGFLLKNTTGTALAEAVNTVGLGNQYLEPALRERLEQQTALDEQAHSGNRAPITLREQEVLNLILDECTTQEIADQLLISFRTVEHHRYNLMQKLEVKNTAGLVREAILQDLSGKYRLPE